MFANSGGSEGGGDWDCLLVGGVARPFASTADSDTDREDDEVPLSGLGEAGCVVRRRKRPCLGGFVCGLVGSLTDTEGTIWSRLFENLADAVFSTPSERFRSATLGPIFFIGGSLGTGGGGDGSREVDV